MRTSFPSLLALTLLVVGCESRAPSPGYDGPIPSREARALLQPLRGATFEDATGVLGGGTWTVEGFAVVPNPRSGKSPVVRLSCGERQDWVPVLTDGDVADLVRRVLGDAPAEFVGPTSEAYEAVWD